MARRKIDDLQINKELAVIFGKVIKQKRKSKGLSMDDISHSIRCTPTMISKYENAVNLPPIETFLALCAFFDINPLDIFLSVDINKFVASSQEVVDAGHPVPPYPYTPPSWSIRDKESDNAVEKIFVLTDGNTYIAKYKKGELTLRKVDYSLVTK